jgi:hypothetical protein
MALGPTNRDGMPLQPSSAADVDSDHAADYFEWNDRIFERYFPITDTGAVRILSFDDGELRSVATEMGRSPENFKESICALIRRDADPFIWWHPWLRRSVADRDPPYYVGLLAVFSLAASQSGDAIEGGRRAYFHRQLGHLLGLGDTPYVPHFSDATSFYRELGNYLEVNCGGRRGRLLLVNSAFGGKYVWRARVQVLLSASSRRQLAFYFDHRCAGRRELTRSDIRDMMLDELQHPGDYAFSHALEHTLELVHAEGHELFEGFVDLVETEYVRWFLDRCDPQDTVMPSVHRKLAERGLRASHDPLGITSGPAERASSHISTQKGERISPIADAIGRVAALPSRHRNRTTFEKRLVLRANIGALPWKLSVQVRRIGGDDWQDADTTSFLWDEGAIMYELANGTKGLVSVDDVVTFANYGTGWIATTQLRAGDLCAVLCSRETAETLRAAFASISGANSTIRDCYGAPQLAIVTARAPRAEREAIPAALEDLLAPDRARVTFRRGLRVGTEYFQPTPPQIFFDHPTIEEASVTLDDGMLPEPAIRRKEYGLPFNLSPGMHFVEVLGVRKSFSLTLRSVTSSMDPYDCEGFDICRARGIAIPTTSPGAAQTNEYMNCRVVIVIGGLLL